MSSIFKYILRDSNPEILSKLQEDVVKIEAAVQSNVKGELITKVFI